MDNNTDFERNYSKSKVGNNAYLYFSHQPMCDVVVKTLGLVYVTLIPIGLDLNLIEFELNQVRTQLG